MRNISRLSWTTICLLSLYLTAGLAVAQTNQGGGRPRRQGNFDPAQFQQRMMERYRERLEISDDAEWKAVQPLIQKVLDARMAMSTGGRGGVGRPTRRGGEATGPEQGQNRPTVRTNPAAEELQKAVDTKVPAPEMKAALAKYLDYRRTRQADLEKAQNALRAVLTSRQEAIAALSGLL
jgi:hypothetical protein